MTTIASNFNQENLIEIERLVFITDVEDYFDNHYEIRLFSTTATYYSDNKGTVRKIGARYLAVSYYEPKIGGGMRVVYKVDKDVLDHMRTITKFKN